MAKIQNDCIEPVHSLNQPLLPRNLPQRRVAKRHRHSRILAEQQQRAAALIRFRNRPGPHLRLAQLPRPVGAASYRGVLGNAARGCTLVNAADERRPGEQQVPGREPAEVQLWREPAGRPGLNGAAQGRAQLGHEGVHLHDAAQERRGQQRAGPAGQEPRLLGAAERVQVQGPGSSEPERRPASGQGRRAEAERPQVRASRVRGESAAEGRKGARRGAREAQAFQGGEAQASQGSQEGQVISCLVVCDQHA